MGFVPRALLALRIGLRAFIFDAFVLGIVLFWLGFLGRFVARFFSRRLGRFGGVGFGRALGLLFAGDFLDDRLDRFGQLAVDKVGFRRALFTEHVALMAIIDVGSHFSVGELHGIGFVGHHAPF